jgi:hypothetical protein
MQIDITPNHQTQLFIALPIRLDLDSTDIDAALKALEIDTIQEISTGPGPWMAFLKNSSNFPRNFDELATDILEPS